MGPDELSRCSHRIRVRQLLPKHIHQHHVLELCKRYESAPITESVKTDILNWVREYDKEKARR
jgi:hypothetical protein